MARHRTNTRLFSAVNPAEIQIVRGAGRAPRGLWVHQKPLHKRDRNRTQMRCRIWPRSLKTSCRSTIQARKGGTATQARPGARQANPRGRRQGKRAKKQASRHQNRPTNIFSSSRQIWPEEQENSLQGHQYRPANRSPAADTIGTARVHSRATNMGQQHIACRHSTFEPIKNTYFILLNPSIKQLRPTQMSRAGPQRLVTSRNFKGW